MKNTENKIFRFYGDHTVMVVQFTRINLVWYYSYITTPDEFYPIEGRKAKTHTAKWAPYIEQGVVKEGACWAFLIKYKKGSKHSRTQSNYDIMGPLAHFIDYEEAYQFSYYYNWKHYIAPFEGNEQGRKQATHELVELIRANILREGDDLKSYKIMEALRLKHSPKPFVYKSSEQIAEEKIRNNPFVQAGILQL